MLYESWLETARAGGDQVALTDLSPRPMLDFPPIEALQPSRGLSPADPVAFPIGLSAEFILTVLRAWRHRQVVCPLEPDQPRPALAGRWPGSIVHFKNDLGHHRRASGSWRLPRLNSLADSRNIVDSMGLRPEWPNLGVISLAHSYGFSNLVLPLLLQGIPLVLVGASLPEAVRRASSSVSDLHLGRRACSVAHLARGWGYSPPMSAWPSPPALPFPWIWKPKSFPDTV